MTPPHVQMVRADSILPNQDHGRVYPTPSPSDPEILALAYSITSSGYVQPLVISLDTPGLPPRTMISGHRRAVAAVVAGLVEVPVVFVTYASADEARRAMVLLNSQREKTPWIRLMEAIVVLASYRAGAKERQRKAGGPRRGQNVPSREGATKVAIDPNVQAETTDVDDGLENLGAPDVGATANTALAHTKAPSSDTPASTSDDEVSPSAPLDEVRRDTEAPPTREVPPAHGQDQGQGEALKLAGRTLGTSANTLRLCELLYNHACAQNPDDPSASEVATKLKEPGAKFETVAREYGLTQGNPGARSPSDAIGDRLENPRVVAQALRRHALTLMPSDPNATPPTELDRKLVADLRGAVEAVVDLLAATSIPALRLVYLCPREGKDLPALKDDQMTISETRLRDELKNALADKWTTETIADEAKVTRMSRRKAFEAWCDDDSVALRHDDLCRLARWVEKSRGKRPAREEATS